MKAPPIVKRAAHRARQCVAIREAREEQWLDSEPGYGDEPFEQYQASKIDERAANAALLVAVEAWIGVKVGDLEGQLRASLEAVRAGKAAARR